MEVRMPQSAYRLTVIGGALAWIMFGMSVSLALQAWRSGAAQDPLDITIAILWLLMGAGDAWWLLRFGGVRATRQSR
jgi:hypothetical protein